LTMMTSYPTPPVALEATSTRMESGNSPSDATTRLVSALRFSANARNRDFRAERNYCAAANISTTM
ncbi:hypothetical protein, partial [Mycobacterium angelicum]|uniref:hypothetical protein n=1 Tax=Mycobacterium angelicum TaxID=470074 RepID=UPI001B801CBA